MLSSAAALRCLALWSLNVSGFAARCSIHACSASFATSWTVSSHAPICFNRSACSSSCLARCAGVSPPGFCHCLPC
eukprot:4138431-Lingulodinium_polyedra.AAC.1